MVSKREVVSGIILCGAALLIVLGFSGIELNFISNMDTVLIGLVTNIFWLSIQVIYRGLRKKEEKVPTMSYNVKNKGLVSRLRFSLKKEKRLEIWEAAISMLICGPILIIMMLTMPSKSLEPQASSMYDLVKIFAICVGSVLTVMGALFVYNLVYDWWEPKQQKKKREKTTYLKVTKDFDNSFKAVQQVSNKTTKSRMLSDLQRQLVKLIKYEWGDVKNRIEKVLDCIIPEKFSDDPHAKLYIQLLDMIIDKYGQNVVEKIKKKWLNEFEKMYKDPNYSTVNISRIFWVLQELHGYDENILERLIDDATRWSKLKYNLLSQNIGFSELKKRDELAYNRVLQYLIRRMDDAEQTENDIAFTRLESLYKTATKE